MLIPWRATSSHQDLFLERYDRIRKWARGVTAHDDEAEELVHDLFVQFTLNQPDLGAIRNLDAYLYTMLRNLHLTSMRRRRRTDADPLSLVDYESAELGLREMTTRAVTQACEDLVAICDYACARKASSKAGTVLILRFFHGYYPLEIAQVLRVTRPTADEWLRVARREAKRHLNAAPRPRAQEVVSAEPVDLLHDLRQRILGASHGVCVPAPRLRDLYAPAWDEAVSTATLAHLVSCAGCLDTVNDLLGLPRLDARAPDDARRRKPRSKGPFGGGGSGGGPAGGKPSAARALARQQKALAELKAHRPTELRVTVNGFDVAAQPIAGSVCEQRLTLYFPEAIGCVQVLSEAGLCLLYLDVEPPPEGAIEQARTVTLDNGRTLDAVVGYDGARPSLLVTYRDPAWREEEAFEPHRADSGIAITRAADDRLEEGPSRRAARSLAHAVPRRGPVRRFHGSLLLFRRVVLAAIRHARGARGGDDAGRQVEPDGAAGRRWLRPVPLAIGFALAIWLTFGTGATVSAAEWLGRTMAHWTQELLDLTGWTNGRGSRGALRPLPSHRPWPSVLPPIAAPAREAPGVWRRAASAPVSPGFALSMADAAWLEMQVVARLDEADVWLGEQVTLARARDGGWRLEAMVETRARQAALTAALGVIAEVPALDVRVRTFADVARTARPRGRTTPRVRDVAIVSEGSPTLDRVKQFLAGQPRAAGESVDRAARDLAASVLGRAHRLKVHAWALKRVGERWSSDALHATNPQAWSLWRGVLRRHATVVADEALALREALVPIFPHPTSPDGPDAGAVLRLRRQDAIERAAARATAIDEAVRLAFAPSESRADERGLESAAFSAGLRELLILAHAIHED